MTHAISSAQLTISDVEEIIKQDKKLKLSDESINKIKTCREYLDKKIEESDNPIYGINTGFGSLYNTSVSRESLEQLQANLVMSHACGTGREIDEQLVKLMLLLKIQGLSYGHSGVMLETVERLVLFFNNNVLPVIYEYGSLGASGDLAPLAHLSLPLLGMGEVNYKGKRMASADALADLGVQPLKLRSKEGLALLNGTQFMSALGVMALLKSRRLLDLADVIGAVSLEGFDGRPDPFQDAVHLVRRQPGQLKVARNIMSVLKGSKFFVSFKQNLQDPYSFRCMPQVHGASRDACEHVSRIFENEINAVTDNPTIFPELDQIVSAGNFHGQPLAINLDYLSIAMAEIGSISERRTYKLGSGERGLPPFLTVNAGLNSGFMIPQYTAASMVSRNKQLCTPASVDTIDSSNGQEDHVSMGANAAVKLLDILKNVETILAIELMNGMQALEIRENIETSEKVRELHKAYRQKVKFMEVDKPLYYEIENSRKFLSEIDVQNLLN